METRFPKWRPGFVSRRKRASLRPKGPHYWVKCNLGEPIPSSQPNEGSVQGRKEKKRIKQRKDFIMIHDATRQKDLRPFGSTLVIACCRSVQ